MPNTKSAEKAVRQSNRKRLHNIFWKKKVKAATKTLNDLLETKAPNADILKKEASMLAKAVDKAAKEKVIHKNKANRLKSRYAKKIAALLGKAKTESTSNKAESKSAKAGSKVGAKSKSKS